MINVENDIFSFVAEDVREKFPEAFVTGEYVKTPPRFPALSIVEMDNSVYQRTRSSDRVENHAELMYQVDGYSNKTSGKKSECRAIMAAADEQFAKLGFTRTMMQPIPNIDDATIYRMTARYTAVVSRDKTIFRR